LTFDFDLVTEEVILFQITLRLVIFDFDLKSLFGCVILNEFMLFIYNLFHNCRWATRLPSHLRVLFFINLCLYLLPVYLSVMGLIPEIHVKALTD